MQSVVRQNLHSETEVDLNKLINLKLTASYTYLALVRLVNAIKDDMDCEKQVCKSANHSFWSFVLPKGMYFDRDDIALPHFSTFFLERSEKEREQAEKLLEYQNMRGGRILLQTIAVSAPCLGNKQTPQISFSFPSISSNVAEAKSGGLDRWSGRHVLFFRLPEVSEHVHPGRAPPSWQPY